MQFQALKVNSGNVLHAGTYTSVDTLVDSLLRPRPEPPPMKLRDGKSIRKTVQLAPSPTPAEVRARQQSEQICNQVLAWCAGADAGDSLFVYQEGLLISAASDG